MKAILVIDMPSDCAECQFCGFGGINLEKYVCSLTREHSEGPHIVGCPLKPLPQKKHNNGGYRVIDGTKWFYDSEHDDGWNACLDEILGAEDDR